MYNCPLKAFDKTGYMMRVASTNEIASGGVFVFFKKIRSANKPPTSEPASHKPAIQLVGNGIIQPEKDMRVGNMYAWIWKKFRG
jgi:hypothetical protein